MALRQINMNNYTYLGVKGLFLDLFCGTATGTADPSIRRQRRSTFLVLHEGDLEEESGYWVMDQETGEEGFVSLFSESEFWVLAAKGGYTRRRIHGRRFRKPSKGGKGKGRGKGRRPGFVSRRGKGAGAHYAEYPDNSGFYGKGKKGKKGGKKGFKGKDAFKGKGKSKQQNPFQQSNVATTEEPSSAQPSTHAEETWSAHEANWSWDSYGYHTDQYYPEDVWQANEASWQQWTYFADARTQSVSGSPTCKKKRVCWIKLDSRPSPSHSAGPLQWAALQSQGFPARLRPTPADLRGHVPARESGKEMQGMLTTPPRVLLPHQLAMPTFARQGKDP